LVWSWSGQEDHPSGSAPLVVRLENSLRHPSRFFFYSTPATQRWCARICFLVIRLENSLRHPSRHYFATSIKDHPCCALVRLGSRYIWCLSSLVNVSFQQLMIPYNKLP